MDVLGRFQLSHATGREIRLPTKHDRALLAYLALSAGRLTRDRLAAILWEDRQLEQARHSLSGSLRALRNALGDSNAAVIVPGSDPLSYNFGAITVDALIFKRLCREGSRDALERAEALYAGDLLDGFQLRSSGFEEWVSRERQQFRDLMVDAQVRLMSLRATDGDTEKALATAERILELDSLREDAHRFLVHELLVQGDRALALKQVERCESILRAAGITPEPETVHLIAVARGGQKPTKAERSERRVGLPDKPSIAVLPFDNLSGNPEEQYIIDGLAEDIITDLSRFHSLLVIARNSSFQYRGKPVDAKRVGQELGVRYIVEGSYRRWNDQVRVSVQLIDSSSGAHLWANQYNRSMRDLFEVQDDVSRRIVATLALRLEVHELALAKRKRTESMRAYDYWLRGKKCLDAHTAAGFAEARQFFEQAIAVDPTYARAYSGLSYVYNMAPFYSDWGGKPPHESHDKAFALAREAVSLDETDHQPHIVLGWCQLWRRNYQEATHEFELAFELNPNDADALAYRGFYQIYIGNPEAAVMTVKMAIRLNPHRPDWYVAHLACAHFVAQQYEEAIITSEGLRDVWPEYPAWMASLLAHAGRLEDAQQRAAAFLSNIRQIWAGAPDAGAKEYVQWMLNWNPFRRQNDTEHLLSGLRKSGLIPSDPLKTISSV